MNKKEMMNTDVYFYLGRDNGFSECLNSTDHEGAVLLESYIYVRGHGYSYTSL